MEVLHEDPESAGEMSMASTQMRTLALTVAIVLVAAGGVGLFAYTQYSTRKDSAGTPVTRISTPSGMGVKFTAAKTYGIESGPIQRVLWHPKIFVDGRVLVNPHATLEVKAPFAGVLSAGELFRIAAPVKAHDELALFEARFSPLEKLDLKAKSVEADERFKGAEKVLKIREARVHRLDLLPSGSISRGDLDLASIQLADARMHTDIAQTQREIWNRALETVGKKSFSVPIKAPITGEIAEIGAQPGANVEAGQLIVRLVDFDRALVRLDFPLARAGAVPPDCVDIETPSSLLEPSARRRARLLGPAPNVEVGLQKASYLYEIVPSKPRPAPSWRPGLYVKAVLDDPAEKAQPALAIPASALLLHLGQTWVYLPLESSRYERRKVEVRDRDGDTMYVSAEGWRSGENQVVIKHAQVLLSEEFRSDVDND